MQKSHSVQGRHRARELATQLLYSLGARTEQNLDESLDYFNSENGFAFEETSEVKQYMSFLVRGVWDRWHEIDNLMRKVVSGWRPERMVSVDRAVLRMAIFEGFIEKKVPLAVAISEAVELARAFGTEDSGKFVNGVLAKMSRFAEGEEFSGKEDKKDNDKGDAAATAEISTDR